MSRWPLRHFHGFTNLRSVGAGIILTRLTSSLEHVALMFSSRQQENSHASLRRLSIHDRCRTVILTTYHCNAHQIQDYPPQFHGWERRQLGMKGLGCVNRRESGQDEEGREGKILVSAGMCDLVCVCGWVWSVEMCGKSRIKERVDICRGWRL